MFYFLGSHSAISGDGYSYILTKFGEPVRLTEAQAANHAIHGARLIPADDFAAIGFTPEELETNSDLLAHDDTADEDFLSKRQAAFSAADQFRTKAEHDAAVTSQEN
jgi:hypothetical protein